MSYFLMVGKNRGVELSNDCVIKVKKVVGRAIRRNDFVVVDRFGRVKPARGYRRVKYLGIAAEDAASGAQTAKIIWRGG